MPEPKMISRLKFVVHERMMDKLSTMTRAHSERSVKPGSGGIAMLRDCITHMGKFLDLFIAFVDAVRQIRAEYTEDVLHLKGAGYRPGPNC